MAEKRMFTMKIVDSDAFLDMPLSAQSLYFHLNMRADDEGFLNNPKKIMRMVGASEDDLKILIAKRFLLTFDSGVVVIKHWKMHNSLRKDRYSETQYTEELSQLCIKENGSYTEATNCQPADNQVTTTCQPTDNQVTTTCPHRLSIDKDRLDKIRVDEDADIYTVNEYTEQQPLPELDDNDLIVQTWNCCQVTKNIDRIKPMTKRETDTRLCVEGDLQKYLNTIRSLDNKAFFLKQMQQGRLLTYDWFCNPNNYQKVVEGNYDEKFEKPPDQTAHHEEQPNELLEKYAQPFTPERIRKMSRR